MVIYVEEKQRDDSAASEAQGRWDVGLGERLVETIWSWLGRESDDAKVEGRSGKVEEMRKAA